MLARSILMVCFVTGGLAGVLPGLSAYACGQPTSGDLSAAFDRAAGGETLTASPTSDAVATVPESLLRAIGWVESGWRQFAPGPRPLVSPDYGYGVMQVTSGMPGADGLVRGKIATRTAARIADDFRFNISYGRRILAQKWFVTPRIGNGDPTILENWYYAIWAYNGWGWVNNPNNPRFTRRGTPASDPASFPYQERVLYLVAHPPRDGDGNALWPAIHASLPSRQSIGMHPGPYNPVHAHVQRPAAAAVVYQPDALPDMTPGAIARVVVRVINTGRAPLDATGSQPSMLTYHLLRGTAHVHGVLTPFSAGVLAYGQQPVAVPQMVLPGKSVAVRAVVRAPATPGSYLIAWDLELASTGWLSGQGILPHLERLKVMTALPPSVTPSPTPTPIAEDLRFAADTSIPDRSVLSAGSTVSKGWFVYNAGGEPWTANWSLHLVAGMPFGARVIAVPPTGACRAANIVTQLSVPRSTGHRRSVWRLRDPLGTPVGEPLTMQVNVQSSQSTPTPSPNHPTGTPAPPP